MNNTEIEALIDRVLRIACDRARACDAHGMQAPRVYCLQMCAEFIVTRLDLVIGGRVVKVSLDSVEEKIFLR